MTLQKQLRLKIINKYFQVNAGHIACSLSCIDLMIETLLKKNIDDTFILSKGHAALALYVCLNYLGEINDEELDSFYKEGTKLPAHPAPNSFKGIPFATGSLGHGLSLSAGMAKADKMLKKNSIHYVLLSDGETNEGSTYEAANFAVAHQLDNLIVIIDANGLQGFGKTEEVLGNTANPLFFECLGFEVEICDGHNLEAINQSINKFKNSKNNKPKLLLAKTIKGKGVSFMENKLEWHYLPMDKTNFNLAVESIEKNY